MNTTREPAPFPDWLGFPTFARLSVACHHDRLLRDTALSVERLKVLGLIRDAGNVIGFELSLYLFELYNYRPLQLTFPIAISTITAVMRDDLPILIDE